MHVYQQDNLSALIFFKILPLVINMIKQTTIDQLSNQCWADPKQIFMLILRPPIKQNYNNTYNRNGNYIALLKQISIVIHNMKPIVLYCPLVNMFFLMYTVYSLAYILILFRDELLKILNNLSASYIFI